MYSAEVYYNYAWKNKTIMALHYIWLTDQLEILICILGCIDDVWVVRVMEGRGKWHHDQNSMCPPHQ